MDIRAESSVEHIDRHVGLGVITKRHRALGRFLDVVDRFVDGEFVRRNVVGNRGCVVLTALHVRPVLPHTSDDHFAIVGDTEWDRVDRAGINFTETLVYLLLQPLGLIGTEVELVQPRDGLGRTTSDRVELVLHTFGVVIVDEVREVFLEKAHHREGRPGRNQGRTLLPHVFTILNRAHDRRVGRRTPDLEIGELLDERRLGIPSGRLRLVAVGRDGTRHQRV